MFFMILWKSYVLENSDSSFMIQNALNQSDSFIINSYRKKAINILDFLHRDNHQRKVSSETTSFG